MAAELSAVLKLRVTPAEREALNKAARDAGMTASQLARKAICDRLRDVGRLPKEPNRG